MYQHTDNLDQYTNLDRSPNSVSHIKNSGALCASRRGVQTVPNSVSQRMPAEDSHFHTYQNTPLYFSSILV